MRAKGGSPLFAPSFQHTTMAYVQLEHAQRRKGLGVSMYCNTPVHQAFHLQSDFVFALQRNPVTCTTIILKEDGAPTSGFAGEDFRDVRDRLVDLGIYQNVLLRIVDRSDRHSSNYRRAEEALRRFARGEAQSNGVDIFV